MSISNHIRNYYEQLVAEEVRRRLNDAEPPASMDYMADVACVALNRLPSRYIRFEVDMAFYMSPDEYVQTQQAVQDAVTDALAFVAQHSRGD